MSGIGIKEEFQCIKFSVLLVLLFKYIDLFRFVIFDFINLLSTKINISIRKQYFYLNLKKSSKLAKMENTGEIRKLIKNSRPKHDF